MKRKQPCPLPSDEKIAELARMLVDQKRNEVVKQRYATVSRILALIGTGAVLSLSLFVAPTAIMLAKPFLDEKRRREQDEWKQFNPRYLRRTIAQLRQQKLVTIEKHEGEHIVTLTKNGRRRILKYSLDELSIEKPGSWDGRWRMVIYDVGENKKYLRDIFRETLKGLGFYHLQESVWLYPYPCEKEITFLREYYNVRDEVFYVVATKLEDDSPYQTYFGLS